MEGQTLPPCAKSLYIDMSKQVEIGAYYFPNFHAGDATNERYHGKGWSEWELVKSARSRFPGHKQPKVPLWGYQDEALPAVMEQKIDAAASHGLDYFLFDWYWYNDGPMLNGALDRGFLNATNSVDLKFAIMWANHDWVNGHPWPYSRNAEMIYPGVIAEDNFDRACDYVIEHYFMRPNYYKLDGAPYFAFYQFSTLLKMFGSFEGVAKKLAQFREKTKRAGFPDLHLNLVLMEMPVLPGETDMKVDLAGRIEQLGFSSVSSYVWCHHVGFDGLKMPYDKLLDAYMKTWDGILQRFPKVPYYPNVSVGWDPSPRTMPTDGWEWDHGYPYSGVYDGNTPENFMHALQCVLARAVSLNIPTMSINAWNEWTEGSMLEPEEEYGYGYLDAIKDVFANG